MGAYTGGSQSPRRQLVDLYPWMAELLAKVEADIRQVQEKDSDFLGLAARQAVSGRGKRLRPSLLLLSAKCAGGVTASSIALAGVVEIVHSASLVHDDVVDGASSRRGRRSANARWGNKVSVLLGDYLIARAFELVPMADREWSVPELAGVAAQMCTGQVTELRAAGRPLTQAEYLEIAQAKTGALFGFCGYAGARTAGGSETTAESLHAFGEKFGVAFQFADDILDLVGTDGRSGKPEGRDLAEGKFTLPLILAVEMGGPSLAAELTALLGREEVLTEDVLKVRELVESTGAVEAAWKRISEWLASARGELEDLPDGEAKLALMALCGELFPMPVMAEAG